MSSVNPPFLTAAESLLTNINIEWTLRDAFPESPRSRAGLKIGWRELVIDTSTQGRKVTEILRWGLSNRSNAFVSERTCCTGGHQWKQYPEKWPWLHTWGLLTVPLGDDRRMSSAFILEQANSRDGEHKLLLRMERTSGAVDIPLLVGVVIGTPPNGLALGVWLFLLFLVESRFHWYSICHAEIYTHQKKQGLAFFPLAETRYASLDHFGRRKQRQSRRTSCFRNTTQIFKLNTTADHLLPNQNVKPIY